MRPGASCQLPVEVSMENTDPHHLQGGGYDSDYLCGFPTPTPWEALHDFPTEQTGCWLGALPWLRSESARWGAQAWLTHAWHPAATEPALLMPHPVPTNRASSAKVRTLSFFSRFLQSCLLHTSGEKGRRSKGERQKKKRNEGAHTEREE